MTFKSWRIFVSCHIPKNNFQMGVEVMSHILLWNKWLKSLPGHGPVQFDVPCFLRGIMCAGGCFNSKGTSGLRRIFEGFYVVVWGVKGFRKQMLPKRMENEIILLWQHRWKSCRWCWGRLMTSWKRQWKINRNWRITWNKVLKTPLIRYQDLVIEI